MKYFISAGEASGDLHAAQLVEALRKEDAAAEFTFLGGGEMSRAAGAQPLIHYRDMAFMGFVDVAMNLRKVLRNLRTAKDAISQVRPDAVILVDYPSFNLRLARHAHRLGIPVYWYISPKVWAWKEGRVKKMRRYVDRLFSILPFEPRWFAERHGWEVEYVGNPSAREIESRLSRLEPRAEFLEKHHMEATKPLLALIPGSRVSEVRRNLPIMAAVARRHPEMEAVIARAPGLDDKVFAGFSDFKTVEGDTMALMAHARAALVTSGTATLECALAGTPQVACYRANGSKIAYNIMKRVLKVKFVTLPNLIAGREVIPEMLLHRCTPDMVDFRLRTALTDEGCDAQLQGYTEIRRLLGDSDPADTAARQIAASIV